MSGAIAYRVEREYQMRFKSVLEHYANMKFSIRATARDLGISHTQLRRLAQRYKVKFPSQAEQNSVCRGGRPKEEGHVG